MRYVVPAQLTQQPTVASSQSTWPKKIRTELFLKKMCSRTTITYSSNLNVMRFFVFFFGFFICKKKTAIRRYLSMSNRNLARCALIYSSSSSSSFNLPPAGLLFYTFFLNVLFLVFFLSTRCSIASLPAVGSPAMVRKRFDYLAAQGFQQTQFLSSEFLAAQTFVPAILICLQAFVRAAILIRRVGQLLFASTYEGCNQIQYMTGQSVTRRTFAH